MPDFTAAASCSCISGAARSTGRSDNLNSSSDAAADSSSISHPSKELYSRNASSVAAAAAAAVEQETHSPGEARNALSMPVRPACAAESSSSSPGEAGGSSCVYAGAAAAEEDNRSSTEGVAGGENRTLEDAPAAETDVVCSRPTESSSRAGTLPAAASENSNSSSSSMTKRKIVIVSDKRSEDGECGAAGEAVINGNIDTGERRFWKPELFEESVQLLRQIEQCIAATRQQQQKDTRRADEGEREALPLLLSENARRGQGRNSSNRLNEGFISSTTATTQGTTEYASPVPPVVRQSAAAAAASPHPAVTPHTAKGFTLRPPPVARRPETEAAAKKSRSTTSPYEAAAEICSSSPCCALLSSAARAAAPASPHAATAWTIHTDACCAAAAAAAFPCSTQDAATPVIDSCAVPAAPLPYPHLHTSVPAVAAPGAAAAAAAPGAAVTGPATAVASVPTSPAAVASVPAAVASVPAAPAAVAVPATAVAVPTSPAAVASAPAAVASLPAALASVPAAVASVPAAASGGVALLDDSAAANAATDSSSSSSSSRSSGAAAAAAGWDDRAAAPVQQQQEEHPCAARTTKPEQEASVSAASAAATEASAAATEACAAAAVGSSSSLRDPSFESKSETPLLEITTCVEIERAIELLVGVFRLVGPAAVVVSFNGGKDAVATLHLYRAALARFVLQTEQQEAERQQQQQQQQQEQQQQEEQQQQQQQQQEQQQQQQQQQEQQQQQQQQQQEQQQLIEKTKIKKEEAKADEKKEEEGEQQKKKEGAKVQDTFSSCRQAAGRSRIPRPKAIYFDGGEEEIEEVASFVQQTARDFDLDITVYTTDLSQGMEDFVKKQRALPVLAVLLGTRRGDPNARDLAPLQVSDAWLPPFLRVHPVADFSYGTVWQFLKTFHLPYCALYDRGYTSLGRKHDTMPNPMLFSPTPTPRFLPADQLLDWSQERAGRRPHSDCDSLVAAVAGAQHGASTTTAAAAAGTSFSVPPWQMLFGFAPTATTRDTRDTWSAADAGACAAHTTATSPVAGRTAVAATTQVDDDGSTDVSSRNSTATRCAASITPTRDASACTTATESSPVVSTAVSTRASTCRRKSFAAALSLVATVAGSAAAASARPLYPSVASREQSAADVSVYAGKLQHQMPDTVCEARDDTTTNEYVASE